MPSKRQSTRREFLQGRAAAEAIVHVLDGANEANRTPFAPELEALRARAMLLEIGRPAMACQFEVLLNNGQYPTAAEVAMAVLDLIDRLEAQLTVYRPQSEVMDLNAAAAQAPVLVEARLFELLAQAKQLSEATGGAFDITSGPLTKLWGFHRREGRVPSSSEIEQTLKLVGRHQLELNAKDQTVAFARSGMEINLGAIGKGYALDRGGELLLAAGVNDFLFHGGLSSVLARGTRLGHEEGAAGWIVGLRHPLNPQRRLAEFCLSNAALGTSGTGAQFFQYQGKRYGHILDPRTGYPAEGVLSATVIAPTAALADALSTAFYVLGTDKALEWCASHSEIQLGVLFTTAAAQAGAVNVHTYGLAEGGWQLVSP